MMKNITNNNKIGAVLFALLAASLYALNSPISKLLIKDGSSTFIAGFLYLGAGVGVGIMYLFQYKKEEKANRLSKHDLPYTIGMVVLDIAAPIFLMWGIKIGSAANASLLGNFEIVATTVIALVFFREKVSAKLWIAIAFITASSIVLSLDGTDSLNFSYGSLLVIAATCCWGLENNCTRNISGKSTYEIVTIKGICSGLGSILIALVLGDSFPSILTIVYTMILGFVSFGLSIFLYIRAQRVLGAAKTSAYYSVSPFIGAFLSFVLVGKRLSFTYAIAFGFMIIGTVFVVMDTLFMHHKHMHTHTILHTHDGTTHTHIIEHERQ